MAELQSTAMGCVVGMEPITSKGVTGGGDVSVPMSTMVARFLSATTGSGVEIALQHLCGAGVLRLFSLDGVYRGVCA